jgi:cysteinyl-tRNA synthetase
MLIKNTVRLYNTLSREIEDFIPVANSNVGIYSCGPTVYDYPHLGHLRRYILDDVLVRLLRHLAYNVTHVMNVTDVGHLVSDSDTGEDKLEKGARREGKTAWEVAKFFEKEFFRAMQAVRVKRPDIVCRATEHIPEQITLIQALEKKGFTYKIADGIYFDTTKFPEYGKMAKLNLDGQQAGARVEVVTGKKQATDFALWKLTPSGTQRDMEWDSPWGKGFPGWHIECSAMSLKYLGSAFAGTTFNPEQATTIDIHTGGIDHIPIHHTNEIAQSEAATGKQFVKFWLHHNFLQIDGAKMSKSLENFYTIDDILKKSFDPLALRYLFLTTHYRSESNFTWAALEAAQTAYKQLKNHVNVIAQQKESGERSQLSTEKLDKVNSLRKRFKDVLRLDLNTPQAVAILWEVVKSNVPPSDKYDLLSLIDDMLGLGLKSVNPAHQMDAPGEEVIDLLNQRQKLRSEKKFAESDEVRKSLETLGWLVEDTPSGPKLMKK